MMEISEKLLDEDMFLVYKCNEYCWTFMKSDESQFLKYSHSFQ